MSLTRRGFLGLGAAATAEVAALGTGGWAGYKLHPRAMAAQRPGTPENPRPTVVTGSFPSPHMRTRTVEFAISYPAGFAPGEGLPVVLALYGRGDTYRTALAPGELDLVAQQSGAVNSVPNVTPFAIATVEAGPAAYWHDRSDGRKVQAMILGELLPELARRGLRTERIGLLGWSMGGYGALLLAERLASATVAAAAVFAPALFNSYRHASPVAFDSAADFAANDVPVGVAKLTGIPVRIVCGKQDPFYDQVRKFVALPHQPAVVTSFGSGGHDFGYWRTQTAAQLQFIGTRLPMR